MLISNNRTSFHLWWKKNFVKHWKASKCFETDYRSKFAKTSIVVDYWGVYLSTSELFGKNLVKLNRPNFASNIAWTRTHISSSKSRKH